jgi:hypothetical protein
MIFLGSVFFLLLGALMVFTNPLGPPGMTDFQQVYWSARCIAHHHDPYQMSELMNQYAADMGALPPDIGAFHTMRLSVFIAPNLPSSLFLVAPLSLLRLNPAAAIWASLIAAGFIAACYFMWKMGAEFAPRASGALIFLLLVNGGILLLSGNTAGLVIGLSILAVYCIVQDRFGWIGAICFAIALSMKPHDAGPLWLYFLLAGGAARKRALQALALTAAIALPAILWVAHAAPHWLPELDANLAAGLAHGGFNNPGSNTAGGRGAAMIISLQSFVSLFRDDPRFYNPVVWLICGALFLLWSIKTIRSGFSPRAAWFALAPISALALLPVYHRSYDARLILLAVPACAMLWKQGGRLAWCALAITLAAIVLTGDIFWIVLFQITHYSGLTGTWGVILAPLSLLALAVFYLYIYLRIVPAVPHAAEWSMSVWESEKRPV